jgi:hypothetical protein
MTSLPFNICSTGLLYKRTHQRRINWIINVQNTTQHYEQLYNFFLKQFGSKCKLADDLAIEKAETKCWFRYPKTTRTGVTNQRKASAKKQKVIRTIQLVSGIYQQHFCNTSRKIIQICLQDVVYVPRLNYGLISFTRYVKKPGVQFTANYCILGLKVNRITFEKQISYAAGRTKTYLANCLHHILVEWCISSDTSIYMDTEPDLTGPYHPINLNQLLLKRLQ